MSMNRYALVQGEAVTAVVEQEGAPVVEGQWVDVTGQHVGPGYTFDGTGFEPPAPPARHITQLAFLSRFTDVEAVGIDLASIGSTEGAAMVRRYLAKVNAAKYIDLDRDDTRSGVQALEATGLLGASRAAVILDAPVQPHEVA